ncbi:MAG: hypothetical protein Q9222_000811 [Ikaeria aurantiellina]
MPSRIEGLWEKALASLNNEDKPFADSKDLDKRAFLLEITKLVEEKQKQCADKEWKIKRNGKVIPLRDIFGRMVSWINKFKEVGDVAVYYDPAHAALPWAAVRFVLQAFVNEHQINEALVDGLEYITSLIARFAMAGGLYLSATSLAREQLSDAIVRLYGAVLVYLAKAAKFYSRSTGGRRMKAMMQQPERSVVVYLEKIQSEERKVDELARLLDADYLRQMSSFMEQQFSRYHNKLDSLDQGLRDLQITLAARPATQSVSLDQVSQWIDAVFTKEEYERALAARVNGSCNWILQREEFRSWASPAHVDDVNRVLWISGPAGFGKSILCARLINYLQMDLGKIVAYFFCSFADELKRQPRSILRSWTMQLILQHESALDVAKRSYLERQSPLATEQDLWHLLKKINAQIGDCVFVVDGYDECSSETPNIKSHATASPRAAFLKCLVDSITDSVCRLLLVSREDHNIRERLAATALIPEYYRVWKIRITQQDTFDDVNTFSTALVERRLPDKTKDLRKDLAASAAEKSEGMFLWVGLLHERLSPGKNARQLRKLISDTPTGLNQAYERDLEAIHDLPVEGEHRAFKILLWVLHSLRPLTVQELTEALLVGLEDDNTSYPVECLPDAYDESYVNDQLRQLCGSLIDIKARNRSSDIADHTVQFVHFSVKEFLAKALERHSPPTPGGGLWDIASTHDFLARLCLQYLCYDDFIQTQVSTKEQYEKRVGDFPFLRYASNAWFMHASRQKPSSSQLIALSNRLHDPSSSRWRLYSEVLLHSDVSLKQGDEDFAITLDDYKGKWPDPLYLACMIGLFETVNYVLNQGVDINARSGAQFSALHRAASAGDVATFELLLDRGADPLIIGGVYDSVINAAADVSMQSVSSDTAEAMIKTLLSKGADVDVQSTEFFDGKTALHFTSSSGKLLPSFLLYCEMGNLAVLQLLLDAGAALDCNTFRQWTPLHVACETGQAQAVAILLRRGANSTARIQDDDEVYDKSTPLIIAADHRHDRVVETLLEHGAEVDDFTKAGFTALHLAAREGDCATANILLDHGADISALTKKGWAALHLAADEGFPALIELLLDHGNDVEALGGTGMTALHVAAMQDYPVIAEMLLSRGANVNVSDAAGNTALKVAIAHTQPEVTELLLSRGADVNSSSEKSSSPLYWAVTEGDAATVRLLLENGASIDSQWGIEQRTSLFQAICKKDYAITEVLLKYGANPNLALADGTTCLHEASLTDQDATIQALIEHGALIDRQQEKGWTSLSSAVFADHSDSVGALLRLGANPNIAAEAGWTCLHDVARSGNVGILQHLIEENMDLNTQDDSGCTALAAAAWWGHLEIVKTLLGKGADPNIAEDNGSTALHYASKKGHAEMVDALLKAGADPARISKIHSASAAIQRLDV